MPPPRARRESSLQTGSMIRTARAAGTPRPRRSRARTTGISPNFDQRHDAELEPRPRRPALRRTAYRLFQELMAMPSGKRPTLTGAPAVPVATRMGVTIPHGPGRHRIEFTTYTTFPSGVIVRSAGAMPTLMALSAVPFTTRIGVTVPEPRLVT